MVYAVDLVTHLPSYTSTCRSYCYVACIPNDPSFSMRKLQANHVIDVDPVTYWPTSHLHADYGIHVEASQLPSFDDCDAHLDTAERIN